MEMMGQHHPQHQGRIIPYQLGIHQGKEYRQYHLHTKVIKMNQTKRGPGADQNSTTQTKVVVIAQFGYRLELQNILKENTH